MIKLFVLIDNSMRSKYRHKKRHDQLSFYSEKFPIISCIYNILKLILTSRQTFGVTWKLKKIIIMIIIIIVVYCIFPNTLK